MSLGVNTMDPWSDQFLVKFLIHVIIFLPLLSYGISTRGQTQLSAAAAGNGTFEYALKVGQKQSEYHRREVQRVQFKV